jgi:hypothetical protein
METTAALANFNFDFSIVRMEPPAEYRAIGNRLSKRRKEEAEGGKIHTTARKLGALFADIVPHVPSLEKIYGLRASEIVENRTINPEGSSSHGALQGYVGLDATSIWAAATSGRGAIQVHLLACILARQWSPSEAIAIWGELVSARKSELESHLQEDQFHLGQLMAAQVDVGPSKLAQWDASARSVRSLPFQSKCTENADRTQWLHAADKMFPFQQKQLMLIIDNIDRNLSSKDAVYKMVIRIWCNALSFMEQIASGMALSADNPDIFLGLSAWHLYPDMTVLGSEPKHVSQKDKLVPEGAMVTIGMERSQNTKHSGGSGIAWTIPLSRLKYYGRPKVSTSLLGTGSSRAPFDRIIQIALGSLISDWGSNALDLSNVLNFFVALAQRCHHESCMTGHLGFNNNSATYTGWSKLFADQAEKYHLMSAVGKQEFSRYVNLGKRRYRGFISAEDAIPPLFKMTDTLLVMSFLDTETQIAYLRDHAAKNDFGIDLRNAVILYGDGRSSGIASMLPQTFGLASQSTPQSHRRWILLRGMSLDEMKLQGIVPQESEVTSALEEHSNISASYALLGAGEHSINVMNKTNEPCGFIQRGDIVEPNSGRIVDRFSTEDDRNNGLLSIFHWMPAKRTIELNKLHSFLLSHSTKEISDRHKSGWTIAAAKSQYEGMTFRLVGNTKNVALYVPIQDWRATTKLESPLDLVISYLPHLTKKEITLTKILNKLLAESTFKSLAMLAQAARVYSMIPTANVDLTVASEPLHTARWLLNPSGPVKIEEAFACICRFDSGINLEPADFDGVMGISSNDVMYVCDALLEFPVQRPTGVRCLPGNIGKPGVCLLICPPDLDVRDTLDDWTLISHAPFDGKVEDSFHKTSLHLKLTGAELPLDVGSRGGKFTDAMYVDAVVQVYDRDQWFVDIDVMKLYTSAANSALDGHLLPSTCAHSELTKTDFTYIGAATAIDNWPEIIEPPSNISVVRAYGNWSARLALACLMRARDDPLIVANEKFCWACVKEVIQEVGNTVFILL